MKNIRRYLGLTLLMLAVVAMSSCIKENLSEKSDKVDVTLSFNTRGAAELPNEGIKTLRVLISNEADEVVYNFKSTYDDNEMSKTLQIMGMESGNWDFYVIINEASFGFSDTDFSAVTKASDLLDKVVRNEGSVVYFPKSGAELSTGVPASGYLENVSISESNKNLTINCTYAVAKIILNVQNDSGTDFNVTGVSFGSFFQQGTFLFDKEGRLPGSLNGISEGKFTGLNTAILAGQKVEALVGYLFETGSTPLKSSFTLALTSPEMPELANPQKITVNPTENYTPYTLPRGYKMQIDAVVNIGHQIKPNINVQVVTWDGKVMDVEFN